MKMNDESTFEVNSFGTVIWSLNGKYHRENNLPAIEWANGDKDWWLNDERHRIDGPAIERIDGSKSWWFKSKLLDCKTQEEFEYYLKYKAFL